jgi:hypothetical protein
MTVLLVIKLEHLAEGGIKAEPEISFNSSDHCGCELAIATAIGKSALQFTQSIKKDFPPKPNKENDNVH